MPNFVVERYRSRSDSEGLRAIAERLAAGARLASPGASVRYVHTIFLPEDETCLHLFEADSEADVRAVARRACIEIDRLAGGEHVETREPGEVGGQGRRAT